MGRLKRGFAAGVGVVAAVGMLSLSGADLAALSRTKRVVERVSVSSTGAQATGQSMSLLLGMSDDGRFVSFTSDATNLVPGDTNGRTDIFVRDRLLGSTERVSVDSNQVESNNVSITSDISADGRFVVFDSTATNLVTGDTNGVADIFVRDRQAGTTTRVSVASGGVQGDAGSSTPSIGPDGRFVAFVSAATNLGAGADTNSRNDIFVRDLLGGTTERVSLTNAGAEATGGSSTVPSISANGRFVAFQSAATNLEGVSDTNNADDIFVRDRTAGTTERVSVSSAEARTTSEASDFPQITPDGRFVVFESEANNLVSGDTNDVSDVYLRDRVAGTTECVSVSSGGVAGDKQSGGAVVSADGNLVVFASEASNLVPNVPPGLRNIYVRNRATGETLRADVSPTGDASNGVSSIPGISSDGRHIAFPSSATNLVPGDTNGFFDVFVTSLVLVPGTRIAIFRPSTREWFARDDDGSTSSVQFGGPGDMPVPADYLGLGRAQVAIYRPSSREWFIRAEDGRTVGPVPFGIAGVLPVPGDYLGTGRAQFAQFAPSTGQWFARTDSGSFVEFIVGATGDVPVPGDYLGQGKLQPAVFRPSTREWLILDPSTGGVVVIPYGGPGDQPLPSDYFGIGRASIAIFRPTTGEWFLRHDNGQTVRIPFGAAGDVPVPGDYLEQGRSQIAIFRPSTREWLIREHSFSAIRVDYGGPGDQPLPVSFRPRF